MKLAYRSIGSGPPFILLHGLLGAGQNWLPIARQLAATYQVFLPDLRNHGQSPWSADGSLNAMSADILEFISTHQLQQPIVLGHSLGGMVAMWFACRYYPAKLSHLIVVDIGPQGVSLTHQSLIDALMELPLADLTSREEVDQRLSKSISEKPLRQFLLSNLIRTDQNQWRWRVNLPVLRQHLPQYSAPLPENLYLDDRPVLFVRGEKSNYLPPDEESVLAAYFPQYTLVTLPTGHWVQAEQPQLLLEQIHRFNMTKKSGKPEHDNTA